jgi:hypothetical protein
MPVSAFASYGRAALHICGSCGSEGDLGRPCRNVRFESVALAQFALASSFGQAFNPEPVVHVLKEQPRGCDMVHLNYSLMCDIVGRDWSLPPLS